MYAGRAADLRRCWLCATAAKWAASSSWVKVAGARDPAGAVDILLLAGASSLASDRAGGLSGVLRRSSSGDERRSRVLAGREQEGKADGQLRAPLSSK